MASQKLPCPRNISSEKLETAKKVLTDFTPAGYVLDSCYSAVYGSGKRPHRWRCLYHKLDNVYDEDNKFFKIIRNDFLRECPRGCQVASVDLVNGQGNERICVEYFVYCNVGDCDSYWTRNYI